MIQDGDQITKQFIEPDPLSGKVYIEHDISKFKYYYILCVLCHKLYPLRFLKILPYMAETS